MGQPTTTFFCGLRRTAISSEPALETSEQEIISEAMTMGLRMSVCNGVSNAYVKIDNIFVAKRFQMGGPTTGGAVLPQIITVRYHVLKDKTSNEIVMKGDLAIELDLNRRDVNIYELAYAALKAQVPMLKEATDD